MNGRHGRARFHTSCMATHRSPEKTRIHFFSLDISESSGEVVILLNLLYPFFCYFQNPVFRAFAHLQIFQFKDRMLLFRYIQHDMGAAFDNTVLIMGDTIIRRDLLC